MLIGGSEAVARTPGCADHDIECAPVPVRAHGWRYEAGKNLVLVSGESDVARPQEATSSRVTRRSSAWLRVSGTRTSTHGANPTFRGTKAEARRSAFGSPVQLGRCGREVHRVERRTTGRTGVGVHGRCGARPGSSGGENLGPAGVTRVASARLRKLWDRWSHLALGTAPPWWALAEQ